MNLKLDSVSPKWKCLIALLTRQRYHNSKLFSKPCLSLVILLQGLSFRFSRCNLIWGTTRIEHILIGIGPNDKKEFVRAAQEL